VILVDANLLIYAAASQAPQHAAAREWLDEQLNGARRVGLPWPVLLAFMRIASNPRLFRPAVPVSAAWALVEQWLDLEVVWTPSPTERHRAVLSDLIPQLGEDSKLVSDAHLAALAIEHGLTLCSTDGDFARFRGLRWQNPLV